MNAQNRHVMKKLAEAQAAVATLISEGMTVTHVSIEGPHPSITLHRPPRKEMPVCWKAIRPRRSGCGRETEMAALVGGCEVRWMED